ncbi:MAG: glycerophosphoryl diester phosphodiesterase, partial [Mucilaginibacter polytrichastri]|nr:glycerophosphoryl diester phosphodiesterase [Mucilaginibacter polytrichastri]
PYPHHAWWQIGWITDYLMAETELRSNGEVSFPRGFVTPKVGPHQTYGFASGKIYGEKASLRIADDAVKPDKPVIDYVVAKSDTKKCYYVMLLNNRVQPTTFSLALDAGKWEPGGTISSVKSMKSGKTVSGKDLEIPGFGLEVLAVELN